MRNILPRRSTPAGIILLIILIMFYLPVLVILSQAFHGGGIYSFNSFKVIAGNPYYGRLLYFTFLQAFISALLSIILALPASAFFVHYEFPLKKVLLSLTTLSFILPPILVVLAFVIFWGNRGTVNQMLMSLFNLATPPLKVLYSFKAIILAHIFYNIPLALRYIYAQWSSLPRSQYEAAATQGTGKRQLFRRIILPQIFSAMASSFLIIFLYCFMSFAIILVLGGGPKFSTLEVEVYRLIKFNLDFPLGGALALVETGICLLVVIIYLRHEKKEDKELLIGDESITPGKLGHKGFIFLLFYLLITGIFFGGPLISLMLNSFQQKTSRSVTGGFTLRWYMQLLTPPKGSGTIISLTAIKNSLFYAGWATFFSTCLGTLAAFIIHRKKSFLPRLTEVLLLLPMGISSIVMALGYLFLASRGATGAWFSDMAVIIAHTFIALPFVYRSMATSLGQLDNSLRESALIQGAREIQSLWYVELPLLKRALISGALFSFAISMGEVNAVLILASPERITIPIAIYRLIGTYNYQGACAMGTILIILSVVAFFIINRMEGRDS